MPSAEIITIGTELLLGQLVDTNTAVIAAALADAGVDVYRQTSVGDNQDRIAQAVAEAAARSDAVICAGGLGPTVDDLTREGVAQACGVPLETDEAALADLRAWFARGKRPMSRNNERQAMFPRGATALHNPNGTAPGFAIAHGSAIIIAMPGPPHEMREMLRDHVVPLLRRRFDLRQTIVTRVLRTVGVSESEIDRRIEDLFRTSANPSIAVLAHVGQVDVKLTAKAATPAEASALIDTLEPVVRERLGSCVFSSDGATLPEALGLRLRARGWTVSVAESCTGGLVGSMIASVAGASDYFRGGAIVYSNEAKIDVLQLSPELIERFGAVSEQVALAMALGARELFHADVALAVTGIAGPDGGSADKPVGLVYLAAATKSGDVEAQRLQLPGNRSAVQRRAAAAALMLAWRLAEVSS